jgi:Family of unknown function (DUF6521)
MGRLSEEVRIWNTPIIGAYTLWRFTHGFCKGHPNGDAPVGILHFIATAILTNERLLTPISNKRDSLQSFIHSFEDKKDSDILLSIQDRIKDKREYTIKAIDIAIANGLLIWDSNNGKLYPCDLAKSPGKGKNLKAKIKSEGDKAEILGKWFSKHDISTIAAYLKVVL